MTAMSHAMLRWLAGRLIEAAGQAVAFWMLDTCNTGPSAQPLRQGEHTFRRKRFAREIF